MTISENQRQQTEARIRAAADRLLDGAIPVAGKCDIKTLAAEAGISRAALYRSPDEYETAWHAQTEPDNLTPAPTGGR